MGRRLAAIGAVASTVALLTLGSAAPAGAAPVTSGTLLYTDWTTGTLYTADIAAGTGALTQLGPVQGIIGVTALDVDNSSRLGYAVTFGRDEDPLPPRLFALDANTGTYTLIGGVALADGTPLYECLGLDLYQGTIVLACGMNPPEGLTSSVGTVDPVTAVYTPLIEDTARLAGVATNPIDGQLYGFDYESQMYTLDLPAGTETPAGATTAADPAAGSFDINGALWVVEFDGAVHTIEPGPPPVTASAVQLQLTFRGGEGFDVISHTLPATGAASLAIPVGVALIAVLGGLALLVLRRRTA